jgi:transcriptional regulator
VYTPREFEVTDRAWALALIRRYPFGLLVTSDDEYPRATHLPLVAQERDDGIWIVGHVARANPHARSILAQAPATLIFRGPHAYVSASWYEEPYVTVPTWNYTAVHACGRLRECDAWYALQLLTERVEGSRADAWDPQRLDLDYRNSQLRAIIAFELRAEALSAKAKLSQNRTEADRRRVIEQLSRSEDQTDRECADLMRADFEGVKE